MNLVLKSLHNFPQKHDYNICIYQKVRNIKHLVTMLKSLLHIKGKEHFCHAFMPSIMKTVKGSSPGWDYRGSLGIECHSLPSKLVLLKFYTSHCSSNWKGHPEVIFEIDKQKGKELSFFSWAIKWSPLCNDQGRLACPVSKAAEATDHCTGYLMLGIRH